MTRVAPTALLRYKIVEGDPESEVLAACFESLFVLAREPSIAFALRFLADHDERAELALLALGTARVVEAIDPIIAWCAGCRAPQRAIAYLSLAMTRDDRAVDHLLEVIRSHDLAYALGAAKALSTFAVDGGLAARLSAAIAEHRDPVGRRQLEALLAR